MNCQSLLETLRPTLETVGHCVIAGGAVRDQLIGRKPKDWDVFILGQKDPDHAQGLIGQAIGSLYDWEEGNGSNPGHSTLSIDLEGQKVQLIPSPSNTLGELLETFDWNICLFGWDDKLVQHYRAVIPRESGSPLLLHKVTHPMSTLRRGFRFCDRYKLWMNPVDIRRLCGEVLAQLITQEEEHEPEEAAIELV